MLLETRLKKLISDKQLKFTLELEKATHAGFFTAWSFSDESIFMSAFNANEQTPNDLEEKVCHPNFDLASLTKPLFGISSLLYLFKDDKEGFLLKNINELLEDMGIPSSVAFARILNKSFLKDTPLIHLLNHESSLLPWLWTGYSFRDVLSKRHQNKSKVSFQQIVTENVLKQILKAKTKSKDVIYSDLGYIFLGLLINEILNDKNQSFPSLLSKLNSHIGSHYRHASINPELSKDAIPYYPYTIVSKMRTLEEDKDFGPVHDTNANIFASQKNKDSNIVSCHAGLFGNLFDIEKSIIFLRHQISEIKDKHLYKNKRFFLGLDTKQSSQETFLGHLGYTGTSFWFSQKNDFKRVLLTNRTSHIKKNSFNVPRYFIITQKESNMSYYVRVFNGSYDFTDALTTKKEIKDINEKYKSVWDDSYILKPKNINPLRNILFDV